MKKYIYSTILAAIILSFIYFTYSQQEPISLNFIIGPDDTHTVEQLINQFNHEQEGKIKINYTVGSRLSDELYQTVKKDLQSDNPTTDIFMADVTWTASLGKADLPMPVNLYGMQEEILQ